MKKFIIIFLTLICLVGCGKKEKLIDWNNNPHHDNIEIPIEASDAFDSASNSYKDMSLEALYLLGTGKKDNKYMFLCRRTGTFDYKMVVVNNNSIESVKDLNLNNYYDKNIEISYNSNYKINDMINDNNIDDSVRVLFETAVSNVENISYKPIAVLATSNYYYMILSLGETFEDETKYSLNLIALERIKDNEGLLISASYLDLGEFDD